MDSLSYMSMPSTFGIFSIVWEAKERGPKVNRIFLSNKLNSAEDLVHIIFINASPLSCPAIKELGKQIQRSFKGDTISFELDIIALEKYSEFQKRVLFAEYKIPRSWVSTYGRIAKSLGIPNGSRAVGGALSHNPFPIIIPCHRAIRSNGELGGFQGGPEMKKALLELEGVEFSQSGTIHTDRIYY